MARVESSVAAADVGRRLRGAGLDLPKAQSEALARFLELLMRWNRVYNLTGIRDPKELVDRHLVESLALRPLLRGERIADVGTGAGLPGLPLAIAEPERAFTLIESRAKRVRFLRQVIVRARACGTRSSRTVGPSTYVPSSRLLPCSRARSRRRPSCSRSAGT